MFADISWITLAVGIFIGGLIFSPPFRKRVMDGFSKIMKELGSSPKHDTKK
jgi:hypothetical protein